MERTIKTETLAGEQGGGHTAMRKGEGHASGTRLVVFESRGEDRQEDGFYSYLDGVGDDGNFSETDNAGPYATAAEAEQAARDLFDETSRED